MAPVDFPNTFSLSIGGLLAVGGVICCGVGVVMVIVAPVGRWQMRYYRNRWHLGAAIDDVSLRAALQTLTRLRTWGLIFAGSGFALIPCFWLGVSWRIRGDFLLISSVYGWAMTISALLVAMLALSLGQVYGVRRLRAHSAGLPVYGDLRPRRVADFMPRWVRGGYLSMLLVLIGLTLVAVPFLNPTLQTNLAGGVILTLPLGHWSLAVAPLVTLAMLAVGEALLRWMVALPRLNIGAHLEQAPLFDMLFRLESIRALLLQGTQFLFYLAMAQWLLVLENLPQTDVGAAIGGASLLIVIFYVTFSMLLVRYMLPVSRAYLMNAPDAVSRNMASS